MIIFKIRFIKFVFYNLLGGHIKRVTIVTSQTMHFDDIIKKNLISEFIGAKGQICQPESLQELKNYLTSAHLIKMVKNNLYYL